MQISSKNQYLDKLRTEEPEKFRELVNEHYKIAKNRYEYTKDSKLFTNIILILENPNQYENLNKFGIEDIAYSALELIRRNSKNKSEFRSALTRIKADTNRLYEDKLKYTGEHRELRTQADKDNYAEQLKLKGQLELLDNLLKIV